MKDKLHRQALHKPRTHPVFINFLRYRNLLNTCKRKAKQKYYNGLLEESKYDIRKTWKVLNTLTGRTNDKSSTSDAFCIDNELVKDPQKIADGFCSFFTEIGKQYADAIGQTNRSFEFYLDHNPSTKSMFFSPTDCLEISKILKLLKPKKSTGHDGISTQLLKNINEGIIKPISIIVNKSLYEGQVPEQMKMAKVVPIFKSKDKEVFNNYRPISLLPSISKILEKVVHKRLYHFLATNDVFYKSQYGFRPKHSTVDAVAEFTYDTIMSFESEKYVLATYLDLSKAFDAIKHDILLHKLSIME